MDIQVHICFSNRTLQEINLDNQNPIVMLMGKLLQVTLLSPKDGTKNINYGNIQYEYKGI